MKPLNYKTILLHPELLHVYKYKELVPLVCGYCFSTFTRPRGNIHRDIKHGTKNVYCSKKCMGEKDGQSGSSTVFCKKCEKPFIKHNSKIKRSTNHFCSSSCSASYNNHKKIKKVEDIIDDVTKYRRICFTFHKKKCIICEESNIVEVHHFDNNHSNNLPNNLVPLCSTHHRYMHSKFKSLILERVENYVSLFKINELKLLGVTGGALSHTPITGTRVTT